MEGLRSKDPKKFLKSFKLEEARNWSSIFQRSKSANGRMVRNVIKNEPLFSNLITTRKQTYTLECILYNLLNASIYKEQIKEPVWVTIPLDKDSWKTTPIYKDISYTSAKAILSFLEDNGYVEVLKGWFNGVKGKRTKLLPTPKLTALFNKYNLKDLPDEFVERKAGYEISYNRDNKDKILNLTDNSILQKYNSLISSHQWAHTPPSPLLGQYSLNPEYFKLFRSNLIEEERTVKGRVYCGAQNIRKEERKNILIDGEETVEIDIKANHIRLIYAQENTPCPHDPYDLPNYDRNIYRPLIKKLSLTAINAKNIASAIRSIKRQEEYTSLWNKPDLDKLIDDFTAHNPIIKDYLFKDQGVLLMEKEGKLAIEIMKELISHKIPCLFIHDGFRVKRSDKEVFTEILTSTYNKLFNSEVRLEIEDTDTGSNLPSRKVEPTSPTSLFSVTRSVLPNPPINKENIRIFVSENAYGIGKHYLSIENTITKEGKGWIFTTEEQKNNIIKEYLNE